MDSIEGGSTNANMPVSSKYTVKNVPLDKEKPAIEPDKLFGFKYTVDKNRSKERQANYIHIKRRRTPIERIPPDIIY